MFFYNLHKNLEGSEELADFEQNIWKKKTGKLYSYLKLQVLQKM